ncbi:sugar phosphorylase [Glaciecola sp. XM2]|uniref:sugar phosphorylase n=1 Tax=Glaciecola sp. XM2 TaxID=1914931 RepID=UPI001BDDE94F|nr:sugar phosphorylase [Glaciecola sp. XM2]MBT1449570.1 sugar phosphorylase [Glaciecola sp. XM2]
MLSVYEQLKEKLVHQLTFIYADVPLNESVEVIAGRLLSTMRLHDDAELTAPKAHENLWDEQDVVLITYGDSVFESASLAPDESPLPPLKTLHTFLNRYCSHAINHVHILPFFPYSSDDGFSVIDYSTVNESLGSWDDIEAISEDFGLMVDLVINHCSARSAWFQQFIERKSPGKDFFFTASLTDDISQVVRPRTSPLLRETKTLEGVEHVWCTFSHDQVDFDFRNPEVLIAFMEIIRLYLDKGTRIFRFDAIAFLWKIAGTSSINLPQTHEIVRLMRALIEHAAPQALIITETNIPNRENLTYFGNANEAHAIYNFSLPPLLVNTLVTGNSQYLKSWLMGMPPAQNGTFYFNFVASHDGIGLRPAEGLLSETEINELANCMMKFGGRIGWRSADNGKQKPYELNIALIDALKGTLAGEDHWQIQRFICAHAIMFGLEGIPGLYIHSLLGTTNDEEKVLHTGHNRSINRHRWDYNMLEKELDDVHSMHHQVLTQITQLLHIRRAQKAFHPNATQFTLQLRNELFGYWRQSIDRKQSIFCISNITDQEQTMFLSDLNLIGTDDWTDLISQETISAEHSSISLAPYQSMWLTNQYQHA